MTTKNFVRAVVAVVTLAVVGSGATWLTVGTQGCMELIEWLRHYWAAVGATGVAVATGVWAVVKPMKEFYDRLKAQEEAQREAIRQAAEADLARGKQLADLRRMAEAEAEARREAEAREAARIAALTGHKVVVKKGEKILCVREVGVKKAEQILDDTSDLSVFLKGVASAYGWLNLDLVSPEAAACGLLTFDVTTKTWTIDMDRNPPKPGAAKEAEQRAEAARVATETAQRAARTLELLEQLAATVPALRTALDGLWAEWQGTAPPAPSVNGQPASQEAPHA